MDITQVHVNYKNVFSNSGWISNYVEISVHLWLWNVHITSSSTGSYRNSNAL